MRAKLLSMATLLLLPAQTQAQPALQCPASLSEESLTALVKAVPEAAVRQIVAACSIDFEPTEAILGRLRSVARTHVAKPEPILMAATPQAVATPQAAPAPQTASEPVARFAAGANLVIVNVSATYPSGHSIGGLTAGDFEITEDGVPQRVIDFGRGGTVSGGSINGSPTGVVSQSNYYILGYYTGNQELDGKFRKIEVTLKGNPSAKLTVRDGYYAGGSRAAVFSFAPPGVTLPQVLRRVEPEYSEAAREAKFQGTVVLRITVNTDGVAENIHVMRSLGLGLDEKAIEAVKQWRFTPGTKDMVAVPMQAEVMASFRLM